MLEIDLSLIIPCYNEKATLEKSFNEIKDVLDDCKFKYEIIFVDDFSVDNTRSIIENIEKNNYNTRIKKIYHKMNLGRGAAVTSGFDSAEGKVAGFLDIDLEVHARYISSFVVSILKGEDVVVAHRIYTFQPRFVFRYLASKVYSFLVHKFLKIKVKDTESGFKFFNRDKIKPIINECIDKGWFWDTEIMARCTFAGCSIKQIPCVFLKNPEKTSTVKLFSDSVDYLVKLLRFKKSFSDKIRSLGVDNYWKTRCEDFANKYYDSSNIIIKLFLKQRLKLIAKLVEKIENKEVAIDLGCGSGIYTQLLFDKFNKVFCLDYSYKMLLIAKKKLKNCEYKNCLFVNSEAEKIPFKTNRADFVISVGLLDYCKAPENILSGVRRVLKPGARLIFTIPKDKSPFAFFRSGFGSYIREKILRISPIITFLSKKEVGRLVNSLGFRINYLNVFWGTMWIVDCTLE